MDDWDEAFEAVIRPRLRSYGNEQPLAPDLDLRDAGVDSLALVDLLIAVEDAFGIEFPDELLTGATFRTPAALWAAVSTLRARAPGQPAG